MIDRAQNSLFVDVLAAAVLMPDPFAVNNAFVLLYLFINTYRLKTRAAPATEGAMPRRESSTEETIEFQRIPVDEAGLNQIPESSGATHGLRPRGTFRFFRAPQEPLSVIKERSDEPVSEPE